MVTSARTAAHTHRLRSLNEPRPIEVLTTAHGTPRAVRKDLTPPSPLPHGGRGDGSKGPPEADRRHASPRDPGRLRQSEGRYAMFSPLPYEGRGVGCPPGAVRSAPSAWKRVVAVRDRWRVDDEWWRAPISRRYFELLLEDGGLLVVYHDAVAGEWFQQRY